MWRDRGAGRVAQILRKGVYEVPDKGGEGYRAKEGKLEAGFMCGLSAVIPGGGEDVVMFLYGPQTRTFFWFMGF